ncbi:MAG: dihydropteroate synthase [Calditrichaceae bacterium]
MSYTVILFLNRSGFEKELDELEMEDNEISQFFSQVNNFFSDHERPVWEFNKNKLEFNQSPFIMGILNVTPDSFSDGGKFFSDESAVQHALAMIDEGADIIDIGGESTRPGSDPISIQEELNRVLPVITAIRKYSNIPISIDTYKSKVAEAALGAGANIVNDISGCSIDDKMPEIVKKYNSPIILMHIKGTPKNMQMNPEYEDVVGEVYNFLNNQIQILKKADLDKIAIDPGIGFGKRLEDNLKLLNNLESFKFLGKPVLIGASRKSFLGHVLDKEVDLRLYGSLSVAVLSVLKGADIIRVHDVAETKDVLKVIKSIRSAD